MVSIRRRRQLAASTGRNIFIGVSKIHTQQKQNKPDTFLQKINTTYSGVTETSSKEHLNYLGRFPSSNCSGKGSFEDGPQRSITGPELKKKPHRRKKLENQETCLLRGVYFKNMKWQAAIKVGKKQVHLGTVSSQEEAARLYDRAAFMCGREPNYELSEEVKRELEGIQWEDFLALTRKEIAKKKMQNRIEAQIRKSQAASCKLLSGQSISPLLSNKHERE